LKDDGSEHRRYHEKRYLWAALLVVADLVLAPAAAYVFGDERARLLFLIPALPPAISALANWLGSGLPADKCRCGFSDNDLGRRQS
jgi:hypothetical protein